jgi:L-lactate dehydrogenase complex protein LldG
MIGLSVVNSFLKAASRNGAHVVQTRGYEEVARIVSRIASENNVSSIALARMRGPLLKALRNELASMKTVFNLDDYRLEEAAKIAENVEMGVTLVDAGLAEVGVVVILDGYSARLASTLPRRLAAILPASQIIPTYDQLAELLARRYGEAGAAILIAGPSGTSDIELTFVQGVHGPAEAHFIVVEEKK